eukprot:scaffold90306_cov63-Phaeocystis_antarctica.AAC.2
MPTAEGVWNVERCAHGAHANRTPESGGEPIADAKHEQYSTYQQYVRMRPHNQAWTNTATRPLPGCGTRPRHRRTGLSASEQGAALMPAHSAWPPP